MGGPFFELIVSLRAVNPGLETPVRRPARFRRLQIRRMLESSRGPSKKDTPKWWNMVEYIRNEVKLSYQMADGEHNEMRVKLPFPWA